MSTTKSLARIKCLVGHRFTHLKLPILVLDWAVDGDQVIIQTDLGDRKMHMAHVPEFLTELEPQTDAAADALEGVEKPNTAAVPAVAINAVQEMVPSSTMSQINEILLDTIKKVQNDANYIPQAKMISEGVQVAVNVCKMQIEGARLVLDSQKRGRR